MGNSICWIMKNSKYLNTSDSLKAIFIMKSSRVLCNLKVKLYDHKYALYFISFISLKCHRKLIIILETKVLTFRCSLLPYIRLCLRFMHCIMVATEVWNNASHQLFDRWAVVQFLKITPQYFYCNIANWLICVFPSWAVLS